MSDDAGLTKDQAALLAVVPEDGSTIGNARARETLGWDEERYFQFATLQGAARRLVRRSCRAGGEVVVPLRVPLGVPIVAGEGQAGQFGVGDLGRRLGSSSGPTRRGSVDLSRWSWRRRAPL